MRVRTSQSRPSLRQFLPLLGPIWMKNDLREGLPTVADEDARGRFRYPVSAYFTVAEQAISYALLFSGTAVLGAHALANFLE